MNAPSGGGDNSTPGAANSVVSTVSPAGTVSVGVGASQAVKVTFTSSDNKAVTDLTVTSNLAALPAGWSSGSPSFSCASITTGSACELALAYAPSAAVAGGTLALNYQYTDSSGASRTASVAIVYEAIATPINAYILNSDRSVTRCTVGDDGTVSACEAAVTGLPDQPTSLVITGTAAYVTSSLLGTVTKCTIGSDGTFSSCADAGAPAMGAPVSMAVASPYLYIAEFFGQRATQCSLSADGNLTGCTDAGVGFGDNVASIAIKDSHLYLALFGGDIFSCDLASDGSLSSCTATGNPLIPGPNGMTISGSMLYVTGNADNKVYQCKIGNDGSLSACTAAVTSADGLDSPNGINVVGQYLYVTNANGNTVTRCQIANDGSLTACRNSGATMLSFPMGIAFKTR